MSHSPVSTDDLAARIAAATAGLQAQGWGAMLVSPGPDLTYLTGYDAIPLERRAKVFAENEGGWTIQLTLIAKYLDAA